MTTRSRPQGAVAAPIRQAATPLSGVLFFVHGANETSDGLIRNVARLEDQVRARGWDVRVVAPEWRRRSGLRLGNWKKALPRSVAAPGRAVPNLAAGLRKDAVLKIVTSYFEPKRDALIDAVGAQLLADVSVTTSIASPSRRSFARH